MTTDMPSASLQYAVHRALSETSDWFGRMGGANCYAGFDDDHIPTIVALLLLFPGTLEFPGTEPERVEFETFRVSMVNHGYCDEYLIRVVDALRLTHPDQFPRTLFDRIAPQTFRAACAAPGEVPDALDYLSETVERLLYRHPCRTWKDLIRTDAWTTARPSPLAEESP